MPGKFYIEGKTEKLDITPLVEICKKQLLPIDFWSAPQNEVQIDSGGIDLSLPSVTIDGLPDGIVVVRAVAMLKFRMLENTSSNSNNLDGDSMPDMSQVIQFTDGLSGIWNDAIYFADGQFSMEGETKEGGDVCIGSINIAGIDKVNGNGNYEFYWLQAKSIEDSLNLKDMQVGIRLWYRVDV